jgi:phytoene dehydrogenase-like protein
MKKVIVIGAGVSGLSAAIYAQRSGFEVTLCEQHSLAGGMCTSWKRKGYLFEGAIHWLTGSSPKTELYQLWKETGALNDDVKVFLHEPFHAMEWEGQTICLYRDIEKTVEQLIKLSPRDEKRLRRLRRDVEKMLVCTQMPIFDIKGVKTQHPKRMTWGYMLKILPAIPALVRLSKMSAKDYTEQFEHPAIQQLFRILSDASDRYSAVSLVGTLATLDMGDGGYPEGGSLAMVKRMTKTFEDLGGKLLLKTKVKKVNIENGVATGVTLENETLNADAVIVTQETIAAVHQLFDTPLNEAWIKKLCENTKPAVCTFICVGIRAEIPPISLRVWNLEQPISYAGKTVSELNIYNYAGLDGYAPKGCSTITTILLGDTYNFWKTAKEEGRYEEEKQNLSDQINQVISRIYPQAEGNIEVIDIATPLTYERYTGAYHGSWMGEVGVGDRMKTYPGFLKNLKGLYFAGHRLMSIGGLPVAVDSGRKAAQMVCRQFDVMFTSSL